MLPTTNDFTKLDIETINFPTDLARILQRIQAIAPKEYSQTRNYEKGAVTRLSPYISRGVVSTRQIFESINRGEWSWNTCEKLIQELAWRDYWQQVWKAKGDRIFEDFKHPQPFHRGDGIPEAILEANTGISVVDKYIGTLYSEGYIHNHMRMYIASIATNTAQLHWKTPAKWMYFHLLDGDLASNHLSWQWVAGSFSSKPYVANQENINTFFESNQKATFLDVSYDEFPLSDVPEALQNITTEPTLHTALPEASTIALEKKDTAVYTYYNLDPNWLKNRDMQRVLLIEPSVFSQFPVSELCINFMLSLGSNIPNLQVVVGEWPLLEKEIGSEHLHFKEHPLYKGKSGQETPRIWMTPVDGYFSSFFKFWKTAKPLLQKEWLSIDKH